MASFITFSVLLMAVFLLGSEGRPQLPSIPRELQNINFEQYLRNERAMKFQLKCLLYNGPCDTIGKYIKRNIPIYLRTQCKNCDEGQKKLAGKFIIFLQANYPQEYDDALVKYGKGHYTDEELAEFERELGVKVIRDKDAPTRAPGTKADVDGLVSLVKEGINAAVNTKAPIVLERKGTTLTVKGVTVPQQLAQYTTKGTTPSSTTVEAKTSTTTPAPSSSSTTTKGPTSPSSTQTLTEVTSESGESSSEEKKKE